jgi:solute carrier family 25 thiamine pyrophosphate transporter 19
LSSSSIGACGVFAGAFSKFATYPLDVIKKRYQIAGFKYASHHSSTTAPPITGIWSCASSIVRKEGWLALYKGTVPSLLKAAPNAGVSFAVYEFLRSLLKADSK